MAGNGVAGKGSAPTVTKDDVRKAIRGQDLYIKGIRSRRERGLKMALERLDNSVLNGVSYSEVTAKNSTPGDPVFAMVVNKEQEIDKFFVDALGEIEDKEDLYFRILDALDDLDPLSRQVLFDCYERNIHRALIGKKYQQLINLYSSDSETARNVYRFIDNTLQSVANACNLNL